MLWDPSAKGKVALYDQYREGMAVGLYASGGTDPSTSDDAAIQAAQDMLVDLMIENDGRFTFGAYVDLPEGKFAISHAFNSDPIGGQFFLPKDVNPSVLRYVWPRGASGGSVGGHVGTDNFTVLRGAGNPVLAHEFINYAITPEQALNFFAYIGVPVPQTTMTADSLVADGLLPATLASAILEPSQLEGAAWLQTLAPQVDAEYLDAWTQVQRA
jgi:spermidine/putrescine-binding protein